MLLPKPFPVNLAVLNKEEDYDLMAFDFEVFPYDTLVCAWDIRRDRWHTVWGCENIRRFFTAALKNPKTVFCGFNTKNYDNVMAAAILNGFDEQMMKRLNDAVITTDTKAACALLGKDYETMKDVRFNFPKIWEFSKRCWDVGFDLGTKMVGDDKVPALSLKRWQLYNDLEPFHCPISFNKPYLSPEDKEVVEEYCRYDVRTVAHMAATEKLADFEVRCGFMRELGDKAGWHSTYPRLTAIMFEADYALAYDKEDTSWSEQPPKLGKFSVSKNQDIMEYFRSSCGQQMYRSLGVSICGVFHNFGSGGVHGAPDDLVIAKGGNIMIADFSSMYPFIMVNEKLIPRGMKNPDLFHTVLKRRLKFKSEKDPREKPLKIALNSCYGASREKFSALYDPFVGASVCANGQLLMVNLIERLDETGIRLIQTNTDGVMFQAQDPHRAMAAIRQFSHESGYIVDVDHIKEVYQRDVNNYIMVDDKGKEKVRGGWFRTAHKLKPSIVQMMHRADIMGVPVDLSTVNLPDAAIACTRDKNSKAFVINGVEYPELHEARVLPVGYFHKQDISVLRKDGKLVKARLCPDYARMLGDTTVDMVDWSYFDKNFTQNQNEGV